MLVYLVVLAALASSEVLAGVVETYAGDLPYPGSYSWVDRTFYTPSDQCTGEITRKMMPGVRIDGEEFYSYAIATYPDGQEVKLEYVNDDPEGPIYVTRDPVFGCDGDIIVVVNATQIYV